MLFDPENKFQKQLGIRVAFNSELSPDIALLHVQNTFPFVTIEEIKEYYEILTAERKESSQDGSNQANVASSEVLPVKRIKMNPECPEPSDKERECSIEKIPPELLDSILENSSTEDQEALQKSSFALSSFISNNFKTYREVEVFLTEETIHMKVEKQEHRVMNDYQIGNKRKFAADDTSERIDSRTYSPATIPETLQKLKAIFAPKTAKITSLKIHCEENKQFHQRKTEFITGFQNMLNELDHDLHVEKLTIAIDNSDQLFSVLDKLKRGSLKAMYLINTDELFGKLVMTNIVSSEHWRHIIKLVTQGFELDLRLDQLIHIPDVFGTVFRPSIKELLDYKAKLIQYPPEIFNHFLLFKELEGLIESWKPFTPDSDFTPNKGSILCNNKKRLHLNVSTCGMRLTIL